jgi:hypothetical protein
MTETEKKELIQKVKDFWIEFIEEEFKYYWEGGWKEVVEATELIVIELKSREVRLKYKKKKN